VSVRSFAEAKRNDNAILDPYSKPPTKLTNSWLAGVPAIVGPEPSFQSIRRSPLDFIEAHSLDEVRRGLIVLRQDPALFESMRAQGRLRGAEFAVEAVRKCWSVIIAENLLPSYQSWRRRPRAMRQAQNIGRMAAYFMRWRNLADLAGVVMRILRLRIARWTTNNLSR